MLGIILSESLMALVWAIAMRVFAWHENQQIIAGLLGSAVIALISVVLFTVKGRHLPFRWASLMFVALMIPVNHLGCVLIREGYPLSYSLLYYVAGLGLLLSAVWKSPVMGTDRYQGFAMVVSVILGVMAEVSLFGITRLMEVEPWVAWLIHGVALLVGVWCMAAMRPKWGIPYVLGFILSGGFLLYTASQGRYFNPVGEAYIPMIPALIIAFVSWGEVLH